MPWFLLANGCQIECINNVLVCYALMVSVGLYREAVGTILDLVLHCLCCAAYALLYRGFLFCLHGR
jgi:hypothetical protein